MSLLFACCVLLVRHHRLRRRLDYLTCADLRTPETKSAGKILIDASNVNAYLSVFGVRPRVFFYLSDMLKRKRNDKRKAREKKSIAALSLEAGGSSSTKI